MVLHFHDEQHNNNDDDEIDGEDIFLRFVSISAQQCRAILQLHDMRKHHFSSCQYIYNALDTCVSEKHLSCA